MRRSIVSADPDSEAVQSPEAIRAEAAVWLARLHSDVRTELTEASFRQWLAADPLHRSAFERMTSSWEATNNLHQSRVADRWRRREFRDAFRRASAATVATMLVCGLLISGAAYLLHSDSGLPPEIYATARGERRSLQLADGSHLVLNTDTRVSVVFGLHSRRITLERGQVRFDVGPNPERPFVVRAGSQQILAIGTAFDIRWTDERLVVVLIQGHVAVVPTGEQPTASAAGAVVLDPGERLQLQGSAAPVKSVVQLDREEAWVAGRVIFDSTPLSVAIAEINRYALRRIELGDPTLGNLRISGSFSADDSAAFARALAQMFSLKLSSSTDVLLLTR
jgi:transmembrane sensor